MIVVAWTEMTGAEPVEGSFEWRDGCYRQVFRTIRRALAATWVIDGGASDMDAAARYVADLRQAPAHAEIRGREWGIVVATDEPDPLGWARAVALATA